MSDPVVVIGSGAGGAVTALELATAGVPVIVLEEGRAHPDARERLGVLGAMQELYRGRGMTPIMGSVPIGYVEGRCVGGSTEINSGFWCRTPREILVRWHARFGLEDAGVADLAPHFEWAEDLLAVGPHAAAWPPSTAVLARGIEAMGWTVQEVPRVGARLGAEPPRAGPEAVARLGMSRSLLPRASAAGAELRTGCRAISLIFERDRVTGVLALQTQPDATQELVTIPAGAVFSCAGPMQTPALLQRSGIRRRVGSSLRVHPMLKVAARFTERLDPQASVLPLLQVREFWPEITLGGGFTSPGHLALVLSDCGVDPAPLFAEWQRMAVYYVAVRGTGRGSVRPSVIGEDAAVVRYELSAEDVAHLNRGLARLATLLLAAGATEVYPAVAGMPPILHESEAMQTLDEPVAGKRMGLTTVHAFSTCPMGSRQDACAVDSYGRVYGYANLFVNDASMLPDSPGVNPQASIMAIARRNVLHFKQTCTSR